MLSHRNSPHTDTVDLERTIFVSRMDIKVSSGRSCAYDMHAFSYCYSTLISLTLESEHAMAVCPALVITYYAAKSGRESLRGAFARAIIITRFRIGAPKECAFIVT
jgi:hypothetical protein